MSTHHPRLAHLLVALALLAQGVMAQDPTAAPPAASEAAPARGHLVNTVSIRFLNEHPGLPSAEQILSTDVVLVDSADGLTPPLPDKLGKRVRLSMLSTVPNPRFSDLGLAAVAPAVVAHMRDLGFKVGVYVVPDPAEFVVVEGKVVDKRPAGSGQLTLLVTTGIVTDVRTVAIGERVPADQTVNSPVHARIRAHSPIQPRPKEGLARPELLRSDSMEDYALRLSRHPGRRVDTAVWASGTEPGAVTLDYLITENKPWLVFGQVSNTGTASTSHIREHFGFIHNNLTNNDDVLAIGYHTANFADAHTVYASYEAPIGNLDRWRWRVNGSIYSYTASEVGISDASFDGDGWTLGGDAIWNFHQDHDLFLDAIFGAEVKHVSVDNTAAAVKGDETFVVPHLRLRLERHRDVARTDAEVGVEFNVASADEGPGLDALGRSGADGSWVLLKGRVSHSFFLEPVVAGSRHEAAALAHELYFSLDGQSALGSRLVPNETMVAGGLYTVRGYPESIVSGDTAIIATAEYRWHLARSLEPDPSPGTFFGRPFRFVPQYKFGPTDWDLMVRGFIDAARVTNSDRRSFEVDQSLVGAGVGFEVNWRRYVTFRGDLGVALKGLDDAAGNEIEESGNVQFHFVATVLY